MKRQLSDAELQQRRNAAKNAGRPRKNFGSRAARRAVAAARELGMSLQAEAARNLRDGMRGLLPPEKAPTIIACSQAILARWGNPVNQKIDIEGAATAPIIFDLQGAQFPEPRERDPES